MRSSCGGLALIKFEVIAKGRCCVYSKWRRAVLSGFEPADSGTAGIRTDREGLAPREFEVTAKGRGWVYPK
jgi:hypothetical protein